MGVILRGQGLAIGYRDRRIGAGIDVVLNEGRILALLGPNGGGKTTLLKTLLGLIPALGGAIELDGTPLAALSAPQRARRIAYVPQVHAGTFGFSVEEVVLMGRMVHAGPFGRPSARDIAAARAAIARLGISALAQRPYTQISGGERQLALVGRALAQEPRIIVLDEPTANLDFGNQGRVLREMRTLADMGLAILFTTHDPNHALRHADEVLLLRDGQALAQSDPATLLTRERLIWLYGAEIEEMTEGERRAFFPA